jgi:twitching motility two-component system response regulator PilH
LEEKNMNTQEISRLFMASPQPADRRQHKRISPQPDTRILVIDDSTTVVHAVTSMLRQSGYDCLKASEPLNGIYLAKLHQPDLILVDMIMPGINGHQTIRRLRQDPLTEHIPLIAMSANKQEMNNGWVARMGADGYLVKPFSRKLLFHTIEGVLYSMQAA